MIKLFRIYLREHIASICMCIGFAGIFYVVFDLYNVRKDAVQYAFVLCAVWLVLYGAFGFAKYVRKHRELMEAEKKVDAGLDAMPEAASLAEADYQRIIRKISDEKMELESEGRIARQEMADYYGMWAHQIKTPIAALKVLLQTYGQSEEGVSFDSVKEMKLELFKIEQYVEMVLTYLRVGDMSADFTFEQYDLDEIIRQAIRKYSQMFIHQKIKLNYCPVERKVLTDEKWLVFVIEQILSNALKYTKEGSISIYMETGSLVIEDTGIGIWAEDLPRVFEKGFTGYNGRADKKSTGIGLYLCKSIMDKLRHDIRIESQVGKGTRVYLGLERQEII